MIYLESASPVFLVQRFSTVSDHIWKSFSQFYQFSRSRNGNPDWPLDSRRSEMRRSWNLIFGNFIYHYDYLILVWFSRKSENIGVEVSRSFRGMTASIKMYQGSIFFIFHQQLPNKMLPEVNSNIQKNYFNFMEVASAALINLW